MADVASPKSEPSGSLVELYALQGVSLRFFILCLFFFLNMAVINVVRSSNQGTIVQ